MHLENTLHNLLIELLQQKDRQACEVFVRSHPVLFRPSIAQSVRARLLVPDESRVPSTVEQPIVDENGNRWMWSIIARTISSALDFVDELRASYESHERAFVLENGPIETFWRAIQEGRLRPEDVEQLASKPAILAELAPIYVYALSNFTVSMSHSRDWRKAKIFHQILRSAVAADSGSPEYEENATVVECDWVEIAIAALAQVPDARLLRDARAAGELVVVRTSKADHRRWQALALHRLGVLHLDPYIRGRSFNDLRMQLAIWQNNFFAEFEPQAAEISDAEWRMPPIEESLVVAEQYLRRAVRVAEGDELARSLKALVHTLEWRASFGAAVDHAEVIRLAEQALNLGFDKEPQHRIHLLATLERFRNVESDVVGQQSTSIYQLDELCATLPPSSYMQVLLQLEPEGTNSTAKLVDHLCEARKTFEDHGTEDQQMLRRRRLAFLLPGALGHQEVYTRSLEQFQEMAENQRLVGRPLAACMLFFALVAASADEEMKAKELLEELTPLDIEFAATYDDVITQVGADLWLNLGAEAFNLKNFKGAIESYTISLGCQLKLQLLQISRELVRRMSVVVEVAKCDISGEILTMIALFGSRYEDLGGDDATSQLQQLCNVISDQIFSIGGEAIGKLFFLMQIGKGRHFAGAMRHGDRLNFGKEPKLSRYLEEIGILRDLLSPSDSDGRSPVNAASTLPPADDLINDEFRLLAYSRPGDPAGGSDLATQISNLEYQFEMLLRRRLWDGVGLSGSKDLSSLSHISASLDSNTVLLIYFLGSDPGGQLAIYTLLLTSDKEVAIQRMRQPYRSEPLIIVDRNQHLVFNSLAMVVNELRRGIQKDPFGFDVVSREAEIGLDKWRDGLIGELYGQLEKFRNDRKSHLCIVPHGPLHYFPFHLLGPPGRPLGVEWTITYLPHIAGLLPNSAGEKRERTASMAAIGKSFISDNPRNLPEMADAVAEATTVASLFGVEALTEQAATPENTVAALLNSRYVHISTHGRQNVSAPAFHCLYLTPNAAGEDRLHAYDIDKLDLRGLQIASLSACETALGRVDAGDNLRGLPASLLLAGAKTVIGTLWEVDASASRVFFSDLYGRLRDNENKLDAFAGAQATTRNAFPAYRDWGAFYLIGGWR